MPERASETGSREKTQGASKSSARPHLGHRGVTDLGDLCGRRTLGCATFACMSCACASSDTCICKNVALRSLMTSDSSSVRVLSRKTRKAGDDPVPCRSGPSLGRERARRREKSQPPRQEQKTVGSYGSTGMKYRAGPWPCSFFARRLPTLNAFTAPTRSSMRSRFRARPRSIRPADSSRPVRPPGSRRAAKPRPD